MDSSRGTRHKIKFNDKLYSCSTSIAMALIGGKWKSVIMVHLIDGKKRYHELKKLIPTITERTLSLQLKQLEEDGLVAKKVYSNKPPLKVEYELTHFGKSVVPTLKSIASWGNLVIEHRGALIME